MEILYKGKYLNLISVDGYESLDESPIVLIFVKRIFKDGTIRYAVRSEHCPPYSTTEKYYTVVSGTIDEGENAHQTAVRELEEETGIKLLDVDLMKYGLSGVPICKSTNMRANLMHCTIREEAQGLSYEMVDIKGDGTEAERKSNTLWFTFEEILEIIEDTEKYFHKLTKYIIADN